MRFDASVFTDTVSYCSENCCEAKIYTTPPSGVAFVIIPFHLFVYIHYSKLGTRLHAQMSLNRAFMLPWLYNALYLNHREVDVHINLLKEQQHRNMTILFASRYFYHIKDKYAIYVWNVLCLRIYSNGIGELSSYR